MMRTQIQPNSGRAALPHNRLSTYGGTSGRFEAEPGGPSFDFSPNSMEQPQPQPQPPAASASSTSVPDLMSLLQAVQQSGNGFQGPSFQLPGISGLSAGGATQVGPDGISMQAPDQSAMYGSYMDTVGRLGVGQQNLIGSVIGNMLGLTGQLGTANINAGAQRDVAGINAQSNESIAITQAQSAAEVAGIQTQSAERIEQMRQAGLISQQEADQRLAETNNAAQQRIAEIQAQASVRPAELQFEQFGMGLEAIQPFMQALLAQMTGGGGIAGSSDSYQVDPNAMVRAAQGQNAQAIAAQNRAGAPNGGAAANAAADRDLVQRLAAANAQAAYQIPLQVGQQNFDNRMTAQQNELQRLGTLTNFLPSLLGSLS